MPTQQDFDALKKSPSFKRKLKAAQAHYEAQKSKPKAAAAKKFNLCDSYVDIKPYIILLTPIANLIDKRVAKAISQFIAAADAGCAVK